MYGRDILNNPSLNHGTAFTEAERDDLDLRGLLPPAVETLDEQVARVTRNCARKHTDLGKYIFFAALLDQNETLFYRTIMDHMSAYMPIIYTPTVGEAAKQFAHIFRRPRGLYITARDRGRMARILRNWPREDVRVIVVTDGERILGLGDLGANGMSIPIGKLSLYTAAGGIPPTQTLPIMLDIGTNNQDLRADPLYLGLDQPRLSGDEYLTFVDEFMEAVTEVYPDAVIQFEDFATRNAYPLLDRYRTRYPIFNDDIQGTAAVGLAGLLAALRITGHGLADQRVLFMGAGSAGTGIANLMVTGLREEGMSLEEARKRCWFMNSKGLVVRSRTDLKPEVADFAQDHAPIADLVEAVDTLKPTALIGATGQAGVFTRPVLEAMARHQEQPIIFALSNPTSKAECTAEEAYGYTGGRAVFATGSPFDPVEVHGSLRIPSQANNVYVFPGIGLAVVAAGVTRITDAMFLAAARAASARTSAQALARGTLFPPLEEIRLVSRDIAAAVARVAEEADLLSRPLPEDLEAHLEAAMYIPEYGTV